MKNNDFAIKLYQKVNPFMNYKRDLKTIGLLYSFFKKSNK